MRSLLLILIFAGCNHHRTYVPGILDMRTDGKKAVRAKAAKVDPRLSRQGFDEVLQGKGVQIAGAAVTIEDRHFWVSALLPAYNEDATPEMRAALGISGALVDVEVGETMSALDVIGSELVRLVLPVAAWVLPSWTFTAQATAVQIGGAPHPSPDDSIDDEGEQPPLGVMR